MPVATPTCWRSAARGRRSLFRSRHGRGLPGAAKPQPAARPRRMTFKDRHALETLPARIAALQSEVARLNAELADPDLYARDPARFGAITKALGTTQNELAAAEEQWLTLEMLREEIEG